MSTSHATYFLRAKNKQTKKCAPMKTSHGTGAIYFSYGRIPPVEHFFDWIILVLHIFLFFFSHFNFPASGQAMVTGVVPSSPRFSRSIFIAHRVRQSRCSFHRVLLTDSPALSASQFVHEKKSPRIYTCMHSGGPELTKLTYTRLEDNLIRHRGDRPQPYVALVRP